MDTLSHALQAGFFPERIIDFPLGHLDAFLFAARTLLPAFDVASEVVEDRLPAILLLLDGVGRFRIKNDPHLDAARRFGELDRRRPVPEGIQAPFVKVLHDVWPEGDPEFRQFVLDKAESLYFSSPLHVGQFPHKFKAPYQVIPPAVNLTRFREAAPVRDKDVLWLAHNLSTLKGMDRAQRWAFENRTRVDYYGHNTIGGPVTHEQLPGLMSHYKRFLYLPNELEPFGLTVAEAWASGLELIVDESRVGAMWWIENRPQDVDRGSLMFW